MIIFESFIYYLSYNIFVVKKLCETKVTDYYILLEHSGKSLLPALSDAYWSLLTHSSSAINKGQ